MEEFYLVGRDLPSPPAGNRLPGVAGLGNGTDVRRGSSCPSRASRSVRLEFDPSVYDRILITVEPAESVPATPLDPVWQAAS